jgi:hypothetical protein
MLEIARLDSLVRRLFDSALAPATVRVYTSAQARYAELCSATNLPALPLSQTVLCRYSAWLVAQNISVKNDKVISVGAARF